LDLISQVNLGHEFAKSGSLDRAEVIFRQALRKRPDVSSIHNDLGYVLLQQDRLSEAEQSLKRALQLDSYNISALDSLAKVFYRQARYRESIVGLNLELDSIYRLRESERIKRIGIDLGNRDFAIIFRNLASSHLAIGEFDEAICYSNLAVTVDQGDFQASQHSRLLVSLGYFDKAEELIGYYVSSRGEDIVPTMLLDLAAINFIKGKYQESFENSQQFINSGKAGLDEQIIAQLLKLAAMEGGARSPETIDEILKQVRDNDPKYCLGKQPESVALWPFGVKAAIKKQLNSSCQDG
jgi:tetratricopeptide (TPR) repeat protein